MASFYIVAQYVPDPITGERLNIGVLVYEDGNERIYSYFLQDWQRAKCFAGQLTDIGFLRDFANQLPRQLAGASVLSGAKGQTITKESLLDMVSNWGNSIQFTAPRASLMSAEDLLAYVSDRFVREPVHTSIQHRTRTQAAKVAADKVKQALHVTLNQVPSQFLSRNKLIMGKVEPHDFDVVVKNGVPVWATEALSFEGPNRKDRRDDISLMAWAVEDVRKLQPNLLLGVLALEPRRPNDAHQDYSSAQKIFSGLGVEMASESTIDDWAKEQAEKVAPYLKKSLEAQAS